MTPLDHMPTVASDRPERSAAYRLHASTLTVTLRTDERQGLSDEEARARLARYGPNELATHKAVPAWRRFVSQFQDVLVILLLIATAISAALWVLERDAALPYDAIAILAVVLVNATMGYIQESRAEAAVAALRKMSAPDATVIREGTRRSVSAYDPASDTFTPEGTGAKCGAACHTIAKAKDFVFTAYGKSQHHRRQSRDDRRLRSGHSRQRETFPRRCEGRKDPKDVAFMVKDSKRFAETGGWGYGMFNRIPPSLIPPPPPVG